MLRNDDRSALDLLLGRGHVFFLAGGRDEPEVFVGLAVDRCAHWSRVSVQIHERIRTALHHRNPRPQSEIAGGISAARFLSDAAHFRGLLHSASAMEPATCLGDDWASEITWRSGSKSRLSPTGIPHVYRGTLYSLFAATFSRGRHRGYCGLEKGAAATASPFPNVVRPAGLRVLCAA